MNNNYSVVTKAGALSIVIVLSCLIQTVGAQQGPGNLLKSPAIPLQIYNREAEFEALDGNRDDLLTAEEYSGTRQLFDEMDVNGDGMLTRDEARFMITFEPIPAGSFTMGTEKGTASAVTPIQDASPPHEVFVDAFKMSTTEVTNAQFVLFLNAALEAGEIVVNWGSGPGRIPRDLAWIVEGAPGTKYEGRQYITLSPVSGLSHLRSTGHPLLIPEHPLNQTWIRWVPEINRFTVFNSFEDWPVSYVKWYGAMAFAEHYGLSLPTEAEWEYVAGGGKQFAFATGDGTIGCDVANFKCYNGQGRENYAGVDTPDKYIGHVVDVGSYPANPFGIHDLAGSLWEWCLDWYAEDFYQRTVDESTPRNPLNLDGVEPKLGEPQGPGGPRGGYTQDTKVIRGGSYNFHETTMQTAARQKTLQTRGNDHFGARVVLRPPSTVFNDEM